MRCEYDVIVIGTGVGGTAAGALLAREGYRVLFLEKNPRIGGACSFYRKDGVHVDVGAHFFSSGNRGPIGEVQRRLGRPGRVRFTVREPLFRLLGPEMNFTGGVKLRAWLSLQTSILRQSGVRVRQVPALLLNLAGPLVLPDRWLAADDVVSVEESLLSSTQNGRFLLIMSILMGLYFVAPYMWASAGEAALCTKRAFRARDPGYPRGGAVMVPQAFLDLTLELGAAVRMNTRARRICIERGQVAGVEDGEGRFISSRTVVSNTSLRDTVRLVGKERFPADYLRRVEGIKGSLSAVQAKVLLDRPLIQEGVFVGIRDRRRSAGSPVEPEDVRRMWEDVVSGRLPEISSFYCTVPTNFDPELAPRGRQLLTVTTSAPACGVKTEEGQGKWVDAMLETLFDLRPDLSDHVLWIDRFDNRFLEGWLGKKGGPVISSCQSTDQVGALRPPHHTPVAGLFVVGDGAGGRGIGTELACRSGIDGAEVVLQALRSGAV